MWEIVFFQIWVHVYILEVVKVNWLDDEYLSQWAWMQILELLWLRMLPKLSKMTNPWNETNPIHENLKKLVEIKVKEGFPS